MHPEAVVVFALGFLLTSLLLAFLVCLNSVYFKQLCRMLLLAEDLQIHCISIFYSLLIFYCRARVADALTDTISSLDKFEQGIKDCLEI